MYTQTCTQALLGQLISPPPSRQAQIYHPIPRCTSNLFFTMAKLYYKDNVKPHRLK